MRNILMAELDWAPYEVPILIRRNFTITGIYDQPANWPVMDLGYVSGKILLASRVQVKVTRVVVKGYRKVPLFQVPGMDLLYTAGPGGGASPPQLGAAASTGPAATAAPMPSADSTTTTTEVVDAAAAAAAAAKPPAAGAPPTTTTTTITTTSPPGGAAALVNAAAIAEAATQEAPGFWWTEKAALAHKLCLPPEQSRASARTMPRPRGFPGEQTLEPRVTPPTDGCVNDSSRWDMRRCWPAVGLYIDIVTYGYYLDTFGNQQKVNGLIFPTTDVFYLCENAMTEECVEKYAMLGCYQFMTRQQLPDSGTGGNSGGGGGNSSSGGSRSSNGLAQSSTGGSGGDLVTDGGDGKAHKLLVITLVSVLPGSLVVALGALFIFWVARRKRGREQGTAANEQMMTAAAADAQDRQERPRGDYCHVVSSGCEDGGDEVYPAAGSSGENGSTPPPAVTIDCGSLDMSPAGGYGAGKPTGAGAGVGAGAGGDSRSDEALTTVPGAGIYEKGTTTHMAAALSNFQPLHCMSDEVALMPLTHLTPILPVIQFDVTVKHEEEQQQQQQQQQEDTAAAAAADGQGGTAAGGRDSRSQEMITTGAAGNTDSMEVHVLPNQTLGSGAYGRVMVGMYRGQRVAVKLLNSSGLVLKPSAAAAAACAKQGSGGGEADADAADGQNRSGDSAAPGGPAAGNSSAPAAAAAGGAAAGAGAGGDGGIGANVNGGGAGDVGSATTGNGVVNGDNVGGRVNTVAAGGSAAAADASDQLPWEFLALIQEMEVLARCQHPNIVRLLAASLMPSRVCLVMELMETSLDGLLYGAAARCSSSQPMPLKKVVHIGLQMARALSYLHPTVLHRDLKPANVLISQPDSDKPVAKLADFGLSRLLNTVLITRNPEVGTAPYMAPETFDTNNMTITDRADIYSLGVVLWEMLAGTRPWEGCTIFQIAYMISVQHMRLPLDNIAPDRCPPKLRALILSCWEIDPARRPAAAEVVKSLALMQQQAQSS
ncbi:hypothetical protein PLESTM_000870500 [Pleodorina starrii]|nr:hypothetical protein PLESTM_000870500 [Pleodorina starrii]